MTDNFRHLRLDRDGHGVLTVTLDVQGVPVNVFNDEVFAELRDVLLLAGGPAGKAAPGGAPSPNPLPAPGRRT